MYGITKTELLEVDVRFPIFIFDIKICMRTPEAKGQNFERRNLDL